MTDSVWFPLCLLSGGAAVFAYLAGALRRLRPLWALLSALCAIAGFLTGLVLGLTLEDLLPPLLLPCAVSLRGLARRKGGGA